MKYLVTNATLLVFKVAAHLIHSELAIKNAEKGPRWLPSITKVPFESGLAVT